MTLQNTDTPKILANASKNVSCSPHTIRFEMYDPVSHTLIMLTSYTNDAEVKQVTWSPADRNRAPSAADEILPTLIFFNPLKTDEVLDFALSVARDRECWSYQPKRIDGFANNLTNTFSYDVKVEFAIPKFHTKKKYDAYTKPNTASNTTLNRHSHSTTTIRPTTNYGYGYNNTNGSGRRL